ncbi:SAM-dependent methyltransferase [Aeromicrobium sp. A1-2]|uniref:class I SAM-dependent methyltransferase n=1 Tax=Aeromicrobium sp. A1-2 TaxID=2107713 RepID=UPI000E53FCB0|nr:class I SAM-dependent methyltransferase [Aeromicrobium sp. A1-2]AXT83916.1 SAM-dependent methyltransferase [Aeromicrobium sp. A1-2]
MADRPRWFTETKDGHSQWYVRRFRKLAADGADLAGEARLIDALIAPGSRVLDAGCGPGRVGAELHARGHIVVGVDADEVLISAANEDHPGPAWQVADLTELDLDEDPFDVAVVAGNVMVFLAAGTEQDVLERLSSHVRSGGRIVLGFALDRSYALEAFDRDVAGAGLVVEQRFATWDLEPFGDEADFAVTVLRVPER